jgi:hypothetical protein
MHLVYPLCKKIRFCSRYLIEFPYTIYYNTQLFNFLYLFTLFIFEQKSFKKDLLWCKIGLLFTELFIQFTLKVYMYMFNFNINNY